jgi:Cu+-exporting ATPase
MNTSNTKATDPICGMTVDTTTALHAERDGETSYFCSEHCKEKFLSTPADAKPDKKTGDSCCG